MLNEPNTSSPANVDASILYNKYKEASDKKKPTTAYATKIKFEVKIMIPIAIIELKLNEPWITLIDMRFSGWNVKGISEKGRRGYSNKGQDYTIFFFITDITFT